MSDSAYQWSMERRIHYPLIQAVAPSPGGDRVVAVIGEPLLTDERSEPISHLYLASTGAGGLEQITFGEFADSCPRWSPDGRYIAFLSRRSGKNNVYAMRADGGEAWALTRYDKTDVTQLRWSPDGRSLAFVMVEPPSEERERARKAKDDAIRHEVDLDFAHVYVVPFAVGPRTLATPRQITHGRFHVLAISWLPDGKRLAFTHRPSPCDDTWPETRLAVVSVDDDGAEPKDLGRAAAYWPEPIASPDGKWVACAASDEPVSWAFVGHIVLYPVDGGLPVPLADTPDGNPYLVGWSVDGSEVYVGEAAGVTSQLWALPVGGAPGRQLTSGDLLKQAPASAGGKIAFVGQDFHRPNAVYIHDVASGITTEVAQPAMPSDWPAGPLPPVEVIRWQSTDGETIEGIVTYPLGYEPGQRYPLVVHVHGGPAGVFQRGYLGAPEVGVDRPGLAERGYAVLQPNPRGSGGYGKRFRCANRRDWGGGDYRDIIAGIDYLIARGVADPERLAIQGWSYGGYLTGWAITQSNRFRAAVFGAGIANLISMTATCDIPGFIPDYFGHDYWDELELHVSRSPALQAKGVRTPTLILHGEQDLRVPLSQGRELYNVLKRQGTPVEMVIYPRTPHGIGEPRLAMDAARRTLEWVLRWTTER